MNRELVERATHPTCLSTIVEELGPQWEKFANAVVGSRAAEHTTARYSVFNYEKPFGELRFPDINEAIRTRLGLNDRLAEFPDQVMGPFGTQIFALSIPGYLVKGLSKESVVTGLKASNGEVYFHYGSIPFQYNRFIIFLCCKICDGYR